MKSREMLTVKIMELDRQHTPHLYFARIEQRVNIDPEDQAKPGVTKSKVCRRVISKFSSIPWILGANTFTH